MIHKHTLSREFIFDMLRKPASLLPPLLHIFFLRNGPTGGEVFRTPPVGPQNVNFFHPRVNLQFFSLTLVASGGGGSRFVPRDYPLVAGIPFGDYPLIHYAFPGDGSKGFRGATIKF